MDEASPREKMLLNLVCCVVAGLTETHPPASAVGARPRQLKSTYTGVKRQTKRRLLDEVRRALRRGDVQHVVGLDDSASISLGKGGLLGGMVDLDEIVVKQTLDLALNAELLERGGVLGDSEHGCEVAQLAEGLGERC